MPYYNLKVELASGMSEVIDHPSILAYPKIQHISEVPEIKDRLVYYIKPYPIKGISLLISRQGGNIAVRFGDFDGNPLDIKDKRVQDLENELGAIPKFLSVMRYSGLMQAQFYFSNNNLVDMRTAINKWAGPGMLRDIFGKIFKDNIQEVLKIAPLTEEAYKDMLSGTENVILKTSSFKNIVRDEEVLPLYARTYKDET